MKTWSVLNKKQTEALELYKLDFQYSFRNIASNKVEILVHLNNKELGDFTWVSIYTGNNFLFLNDPKPSAIKEAFDNAFRYFNAQVVNLVVMKKFNNAKVPEVVVKLYKNNPWNWSTILFQKFYTNENRLNFILAKKEIKDLIQEMNGKSNDKELESILKKFIISLESNRYLEDFLCSQ